MDLLEGLRDAAREMAWADRALCAEVDPELFYPDASVTARHAKRVCMACEVRVACLDYALRTGQRWGVWGGLSERQRRAILRQRERRAA